MHKTVGSIPLSHRSLIRRHQILHVPHGGIQAEHMGFVPHGGIQAEHMDVLRNFIISKGGNHKGPCDLCQMSWRSSEQRRKRGGLSVSRLLNTL
jgi:hypothetical protein